MINRRQITWETAALVAGLPLAVFISMIVTVLAVHDSRLGFIAGTFVGTVLIRTIALAVEKTLQRSGRTRAAVVLMGVLVVGGVMWALARAHAGAGR
jgi:hypothetical protein